MTKDNKGISKQHKLFSMVVKSETLEDLVKLKVIRIDIKGQIHRTKFGWQVYRYMKKNGLLFMNLGLGKQDGDNVT